jgi:hypothetical protein
MLVRAEIFTAAVAFFALSPTGAWATAEGPAFPHLYCYANPAAGPNLVRIHLTDASYVSKGRTSYQLTYLATKEFWDSARSLYVADAGHARAVRLQLAADISDDISLICNTMVGYPHAMRG